jgi:hypothetical protein
VACEEYQGSERLGLRGWDADWAWICLTGLWQRWWPEKACLELLDDKIQEGYDADQPNDFVASGRIWLGAWPDVLRIVRCHRRRVDQTGHQQKADELYQSWLDDDPAWGWGWIGWADCIRSMMAADGVTLPGPAGPGCSTTIGCHASEPDEP